jgi:hypothetical protein
MLIGMENVGLTSKDTQLYFIAHKTIDPFHAAEMLSGIRKMKPQTGYLKTGQCLFRNFHY